MGEVGKALTRKLGPAPAYVWLGLFAVVMVVFRMLRRPSPSASSGAADTGYGPLVPVDIGPVRSERSSTTQTVLYRPPLSPFPDVGLIHNRKSQPFFDALRTWWMGGGSGPPPDAAGLKNKKDRLLYESELQFYQANPYTIGSIPGPSSSDSSSSVYDPTQDATL